MQYLGGKLSAAQLQLLGWVGSVRRSVHGALELVWGPVEEGKEEEEEEEEEEGEEEEEDAGGRFQRALSPLRSFARRSRRSLRSVSLRGRHQAALHRRTTEQIKSYCTDGSDTDVLVNSKPGEQQNGSCEQVSPAVDSPKPTCDQEAEMSPDEPDGGLLDTETELPVLPESSTTFLDNQVQRSRAELGKRRSQRTRLPTSVRNAPAGAALLPTHTETTTPTTLSPDWRTCDSTDGEAVCSKKRASESEEEQPSPLKEVISPPPTSQRVPMFPGMNQSALMAQLKKRTGGGGGVEESPEKVEEEESPGEEPVAPPSASQLSALRSPRSPALLAGAARVLPPLGGGGTDAGTNSAPSWLKELKSKKRLSQCDNEA